MRRPLKRRAGSGDALGALLGALAIVVSAAVLGVVVNHVSAKGIPIFPEPGEEQLYLPPGVLALTAAEAYAVFEAGSALFLDARYPEEYAEGHIPGALNFPPDDFEEHFLDLIDEIEAAPKLVISCESVECSDSTQLAERLLEAVEVPVYVLEDGWRAWQEAGYPSKEGPEP